jgi:hypothetical protein
VEALTTCLSYETNLEVMGPSLIEAAPPGLLEKSQSGPSHGRPKVHGLAQHRRRHR